MFGTSISMLTVMDEDRQIFVRTLSARLLDEKPMALSAQLAESGLGGMRDVPRDITFCPRLLHLGGKDRS